MAAMPGPHEPSMEDILASIKRVIAEEKEIRAAAPPPLPEEEEDVLELDEGMEVHEIQPADLGLEGGPLYDPLGNYRRVAGDWNDWSSDRRHTPVSTRTVTPAEQPQGVTPATR